MRVGLATLKNAVTSGNDKKAGAHLSKTNKLD
jgi:hypothetical protein